MDPRCLDFDHHFAEEDLYDMDDQGNYVPLSTQMDSRCTRCGTSMRDSLQEMVAEIKRILDGKAN